MMKKLSILALSAVVSIAPAFAEVNSTATPAKTTAQEMELSFAFDDVENLQVKEMTVAQMQETEGAALPLAYMGGAALFGSMVNVNTYVRAVPQSQRTLGGYATAIGSGAVGGALTATPIGGMRAAFLGGGVALAGSGVSVTMKK